MYRRREKEKAYDVSDDGDSSRDSHKREAKKVGIWNNGWRRKSREEIDERRVSQRAQHLVAGFAPATSFLPFLLLFISLFFLTFNVRILQKEYSTF